MTPRNIVRDDGRSATRNRAARTCLYHFEKFSRREVSATLDSIREHHVSAFALLFYIRRVWNLANFASFSRAYFSLVDRFSRTNIFLIVYIHISLDYYLVK